MSVRLPGWSTCSASGSTSCENSIYRDFPCERGTFWGTRAFSEAWTRVLLEDSSRTGSASSLPNCHFKIVSQTCSCKLLWSRSLLDRAGPDGWTYLSKTRIWRSCTEWSKISHLKLVIQRGKFCKKDSFWSNSLEWKGEWGISGTEGATWKIFSDGSTAGSTHFEV